MSLLESNVPAESITVMIQKEVAERMKATPGSKDYGALSLAVQYYAEPYLAANVPPNCFMPRPNVGSAVIKLTLHDDKPVKVNDEKLMFKLIRASFNQRRKTLQNGIANDKTLIFSKEDVSAALEEIGISPSIRGEKLSLNEFAELSNVLENVGVK
jgi:16S rRNA (adenine1518-N6/adenine1519-N6)-dimethyltransferase